MTIREVLEEIAKILNYGVYGKREIRYARSIYNSIVEGADNIYSISDNDIVFKNQINLNSAGVIAVRLNFDWSWENYSDEIVTILEVIHNSVADSRKKATAIAYLGTICGSLTVQKKYSELLQEELEEINTIKQEAVKKKYLDVLKDIEGWYCKDNLLYYHKERLNVYVAKYRNKLYRFNKPIGYVERIAVKVSPLKIIIGKAYHANIRKNYDYYELCIGDLEKYFTNNDLLGLLKALPTEVLVINMDSCYDNKNAKKVMKLINNYREVEPENNLATIFEI